MPLLLSADQIAERRAAAAGPLGALADGLTAELAPLLTREPFIPEEKACLTRIGGRCPGDGAQLEFDPWSPRLHRCPRCGERFDADEHYRMWIMWYQLWLAERAVHAAVLHLVRGEAGHAALARSILERYATVYPTYPNRDNALGPTRPFFSTYLESIWLLQLCVALDLLEMADAAGPLSGLVRDELIAPSRALIASYDEGGSNRQVWNSAAMLAASRLLGDERGLERAVFAASGLRAQLASGLLSDGTWYEGENYHQFAHRGLWYGVTLSEHAGIELSPDLLARFQEGFAAPFVVALPDFTLPSRRDSQYAISLRQWRYAEQAELGLARGNDRRLLDALHRLYRPDIERRATGRDRSAAESERNVPASALGRADLGWRSVLHARPTLPRLEAHPPRSTLLEGQGLAILRRDAGCVWIALDYGHSGGGHGHPDRLGLLVAVNGVRWLDDMGTGSYVDRSLHWYRSTLAHNAPLVDGRSQQRVHGTLRAWEERGGAGWVRADVEDIAPGVVAERTVVALPDYVLDVLAWRADRDVTLDLPVHLDGEMLGVTHWRDAPLPGGSGLEDGFEFLSDCERAERGVNGMVCLRARDGESRIDAHVHAAGAEWWRATAPGAPGIGARRFFIVRRQGREGLIIAAWSWRAAVTRLDVEEDVIAIMLADGARHRHFAIGDAWRIAFETGEAHSSIDLAGVRSRRAITSGSPAMGDPHDAIGPARRAAPPARMRAPFVVPRRAANPGWIRDDASASSALRFELAEADYRRSEESWAEAGSPVATLLICAVGNDLELHVDVRSPAPRFVASDATNPFDNEAPDIDGDSIQLYVTGAGLAESHGWVLVPEPDGSTVRTRPIAGHSAHVAPRAEWRPLDDGYAMRIRLPLDTVMTESEIGFRLGLIVNHTRPGRVRRAGQLVLGGAGGEWIYLRGDRHPPHRFLPFVLAND